MVYLRITLCGPRELDEKVIPDVELRIIIYDVCRVLGLLGRVSIRCKQCLIPGM